MSYQAVEWAQGIDNLSPTSKGVLMALCRHVNSQGECWPSVNRLSKISGYSTRTVKDHLKNLADMGYIERIPRRKLDRSHDSTLTRITILPSAAITQPLVQELPNPSAADAPGVVRQMPPNLSLEPIKKETLPDWIPTQVWEDFISYRIEKKNPLTTRSSKLAITTLDGLRKKGHSPEAVINQTIMNGWTGLFEIKSGASNPAKPLSAREQMQRTTMEATRCT